MCICFYRNRDHTGWDFFTWWDDINEPKEWQNYLVYVSGREDNFPVPSLVANTWHKRKTQCTRLPLLQGSGRLLTRYMYSALLHFVEAAFLPLNMALQNLKRNINIKELDHSLPPFPSHSLHVLHQHHRMSVHMQHSHVGAASTLIEAGAALAFACSSCSKIGEFAPLFLVSLWCRHGAFIGLHPH